MGTRSLNRVIYELRRVAGIGLTDRELLDALVARRDKTAFEELLRRHGPMVLTVCRRVLRSEHDAEDAFQATFLVLIRKAISIRKRDSVGSWLYGVAYRTARKVRAMNARRRLKERQAAERPQPNRSECDADLDEALAALPERYRSPVVLCELEGKSRKEAARELNIPEGTLSSRLATARKMLAKRLSRGGWSGAEIAPAVTGLPALLVASTVKAGALALAGQAVTAVVSAQVIAISEGVVKAMFVSKLKALTTAAVFMAAVGVGSGQLTRVAWVESPGIAGEEPPTTQVHAVQQAAADLAAAQRALAHQEAELAAARLRLAQSQAAYYRALDRTGTKLASSVAVRGIEDRFKYRVPVESFTEFKAGARLEILEVWGTRQGIEVGGQYIVRGKYVLPSHDEGTVFFYRTATDSSYASANLDLQQATLSKREGEFTLMHGMSGPGYLHLQLFARGQDPRKAEKVADVYFGTSDNVWRKK